MLVADDYRNLTGFSPVTWKETAAPGWCPEGFAAGFQKSLRMSVPEAMIQHAMLEFDTDMLPSGFPAGMSVGRALIEAKLEFLEHAKTRCFDTGGAYRHGDQIAVVVGVTSLGKPCAPPTQEDFLWLLGATAVLGDAAPLVAEEGRSDEEGIGGTIVRNYYAHVSPDVRDQQRMTRLFRPETATGTPALFHEGRESIRGLRVVNSRQHGVGLLNPGEPYWDYMKDSALESLPLLDAARLGVQDYPLVVEVSRGAFPQYTWLPFTETVCRIRVRLEVVLSRHFRHRAEVLQSLPQEIREGLPSPLVVCSIDYVSPLSEGGEGLEGPMLGGVSSLAGYGLENRREILALVGEYMHRELAVSTRHYLRILKADGLG
jgi:hypothetical protein